jgi:hypothetical protein
MKDLKPIGVAVLCLVLGGCVAMQSTEPGESAGTHYWTVLDYAREVREVDGMLADLPRLLSLDAKAAQDEQAAATKAFAADDSEFNRLRLAWLMSLDVGGRNDITLLSLVDEATAPATPPTSPLRQFRQMIRRYVLERIRAQRDAVTRNDTHQHDTETRLEARLREAQARADDLQQKLDALKEIERAMTKRSAKPRKEQP